MFSSYLLNYVCSLWNKSNNRSRVPQKQKYYNVQQLIGQLLVYFMTLLVQICIILGLLLLVIVSSCLGLKTLGFYFCFSDTMKMGFINAQLDSHRQVNVSS